jgi:hypothetical protein
MVPIPAKPLTLKSLDLTPPGRNAGDDGSGLFDGDPGEHWAEVAAGKAPLLYRLESG